MLDAIPEMRLAADLSHYIVDREFKLPLAAWERVDLPRRPPAPFDGRIALVFPPLLADGERNVS
ncbi:hypothetical protein [Thalassococcus sp. BH17M4-6]|uniref:hypothetical protein n=1 Tax=Thalassococcus sp. BH17M4-6 TaxID=3413148 RepID=UPI003BF49399